MRQLTYSIPLKVMCQTGAIQTLIDKEAINVNGQCLITFESLHTSSGILSTMIVKLIVKDERCDYIHRGMKAAISVAIKIYSPDTDIIQVIDEPVMTRNFSIEEGL